MLWDCSTPDWEQGDNLEDKMQEAGLDLEIILSSTLWENAKQTLDQNDIGILEVGHWGVPLMVFELECWRKRQDPPNRSCGVAKLKLH